MLFNSFTYGLFLPLVALAYYAAPVRARPSILLAASYAFYATWDVRFLPLIVILTIVNFAIGHRTFRPSLLGKAATAIYIVTCVIVMLFNYLERTSPLVDVAIWTSLAIAVLSSVDYAMRVARIVNEPQSVERARAS